jgi:hypothetical protein
MLRIGKVEAFVDKREVGKDIVAGALTFFLLCLSSNGVGKNEPVQDGRTGNHTTGDGIPRPFHNPVVHTSTPTFHIP